MPEQKPVVTNMFAVLIEFGRFYFYLFRLLQTPGTLRNAQEPLLEERCHELKALTVVTSTFILFFVFSNLHLIFGMFFAVLTYQQFPESGYFSTIFSILAMVSGIGYLILPKTMFGLLYPALSLLCVYWVLFQLKSSALTSRFLQLEFGKVAIVVVLFHFGPMFFPIVSKY